VVRKGEAKLRARGIGRRWRCDDEFLRRVEIAGDEAEGASVVTDSTSSSLVLSILQNNLMIVFKQSCSSI